MRKLVYNKNVFSQQTRINLYLLLVFGVMHCIIVTWTGLNSKLTCCSFRYVYILQSKYSHISFSTQAGSPSTCQAASAACMYNMTAAPRVAAYTRDRIFMRREFSKTRKSVRRWAFSQPNWILVYVVRSGKFSLYKTSNRQ